MYLRYGFLFLQNSKIQTIPNFSCICFFIYVLLEHSFNDFKPSRLKIDLFCVLLHNYLVQYIFSSCQLGIIVVLNIFLFHIFFYKQLGSDLNP